MSLSPLVDAPLRVKPRFLIVLTRAGLVLPRPDEGLPTFGKGLDNDRLLLHPAHLQLLVAAADGVGAALDGLVDHVQRHAGLPDDDVTRAAADLEAAGVFALARHPDGGDDPARGGGAPADRPVPVDPIPADPTLVDHEGPVVAEVPSSFAVVPGGFAWQDHAGHEHLLSTATLLELARFCSPRPAADGDAATLGALHRVGLLQPADADIADSNPLLGAQTRIDIEQARMRRLIDADAAISRDRASRRPTGLVPVVPVTHPMNAPSLALGLIFAYAKVHEGGRLQQWYDLEPSWLARPAAIRRLLNRRGPAVFLFSNYVWCSDENLAISALVKHLSPESITIHGGPDTPAYAPDTEQYFRDNWHVDITVRGEGEVAASEILDALGGRLEGRVADGFAGTGLDEVTGISFRRGDAVVRTPDRERTEDPDRFPSPYLTGTFEAFGNGAAPFIVTETNRGCPYGCTFCDWGSATLARIRKFPLERVFAELDWAAENQVLELWCADANFGIMARDVEIAEYVAKLHREHGYPRIFRVNYAKNTNKHLHRIIEVLVEAGVVTTGVMSVQSFDEQTLEIVRRSNIKTERFEDLAEKFRETGLPLATDIMMGLPGSTPASFLDDLQGCIDRELWVHLASTVLLANSPMNEPAYRAEHAIETLGVGPDPVRRQLIVSTATYTRDEYDLMERWRQMFAAAENYGVLRQVTRWVRHERGLREIDLLRQLVDAATRDPDRYPALAWTADHIVAYGMPPRSWRNLMADVESYLVDELGIEPGSDLATVLRVQIALLPDPGRSFPETLELEHDYVAWHDAVRAAKRRTHDWTSEVPRLRTFGPGSLTVDDPRSVSRSLGSQLEGFYSDWELDSPLARSVHAR